MGCDLRYIGSIQSIRSFNSRTPCGVRRCSPRRGCTLSCFNSRTPCGVRQHIALASTKPMSFNSRTPCGVRHEVPQVRLELRAFQFTHPVWGATVASSSSVNATLRFNSRTPCGVRLSSRVHTSSLQVSIHAPRVGCDRLTYPPRYHLRCFNSRTPCGVRLPPRIIQPPPI